MKLGFLIPFLLLLTALALPAQETPFNPLGRELPIEDMQKQLRIQLEWIEVSHETYTDLMAEDDPSVPRIYRSSNDGPLRKAATELIEEGEARILDTAQVIARSGQRAKVESIHEYMYPSEWDPPTAADTDDDDDDGNNEGESRYVVLPPSPAAWEVRNIGTTLEVDPVIGADGVTIDLNLNPEIVYLVDERAWGNFESEEATIQQKMPSFYTMRVTTALTVIAGQYTMVGVQSPFNSETKMPDTERKVMVFVKADLLVAGLPLDETETRQEDEEE